MDFEFEKVAVVDLERANGNPKCSAFFCICEAELGTTNLYGVIPGYFTRVAAYAHFVHQVTLVG